MLNDKNVNAMICALGSVDNFINSLTFSGYESAVRVKNAHESIEGVKLMLSETLKKNKEDTVVARKEDADEVGE